VAFHLSRLQLRSTALCSALPATQRFAADVVQGRLNLSPRDVQAIAAALQLPIEDLLRPLTPEEAGAWRFYRISAAHHAVVWGRARDMWLKHRMTMSDAARVMGVSPAIPSQALHTRNPRRVILTLPPAAKLADACVVPAGAEHFITGLEDPNPCR
jgi:hypothetical protein